MCMCARACIAAPVLARVECCVAVMFACIHYLPEHEPTFVDKAALSSVAQGNIIAVSGLSSNAHFKSHNFSLKGRGDFGFNA